MTAIRFLEGFDESTAETLPQGFCAAKININAEFFRNGRLRMIHCRRGSMGDE
jgi:hypothetical protein